VTKSTDSKLDGVDRIQNPKFEKSAGGVLTAKQAPHRPGTEAAHGPRAE